MAGSRLLAVIAVALAVCVGAEALRGTKDVAVLHKVESQLSDLENLLKHHGNSEDGDADAAEDGADADLPETKPAGKSAADPNDLDAAPKESTAPLSSGAAQEATKAKKPAAGGGSEPATTGGAAGSTAAKKPDAAAGGDGAAAKKPAAAAGGDGSADDSAKAKPSASAGDDIVTDPKAVTDPQEEARVMAEYLAPGQKDGSEAEAAEVLKNNEKHFDKVAEVDNAELPYATG